MFFKNLFLYTQPHHGPYVVGLVLFWEAASRHGHPSGGRDSPLGDDSPLGAGQYRGKRKKKEIEKKSGEEELGGCCW